MLAISNLICNMRGTSPFEVRAACYQTMLPSSRPQMKGTSPKTSSMSRGPYSSVTFLPNLFVDVVCDDAVINHEIKSDLSHVSSKWATMGLDTPLARPAVYIGASMECMIIQNDWMCPQRHECFVGRKHRHDIAVTHACSLPAHRMMPKTSHMARQTLLGMDCRVTFDFASACTIEPSSNSV
jgi:hypothetical protein